MYDRRGSVVEVEQSTGHILQERAFEGERKIGHVFQEVIKDCCTRMHDTPRLCT